MNRQRCKQQNRYAISRMESKRCDRKQTVKGEEKVYIGTKVSEMKEEPLIKEFLNQNIIQRKNTKNIMY